MSDDTNLSYYQRNKQTRLEYFHNYYQKNKDIIKQKRDNQWQERKDQIKKDQKQWRDSRTEEDIIKRREYFRNYYHNFIKAKNYKNCTKSI